MALGPGKYDALCTYVRETAKAEGAVVIVWEGDKGAGFSVQGPIHVLPQLSGVLRNIADTLDSHRSDPIPGDGLN